jgi:putative ABC transport system ATP-binding protein
MIIADNLSKNYLLGGKQVKALDKVNMKVSEGDFAVITGPSGSGKSTFLYTLGGLLTPDSGNVYVDGSDIYGLNPKQRAKFRRKNVGFIFQTFELLNYLTALENVMLPLSLNGKDAINQEKWGIESLEKVGLGKRLHHKPNELSGGEQQRVAIARGLVNEPRLLLADEPTGNLDRKTGDGIIDLLLNLNEEGQTILFVTHDGSRASIANKMVEMVDGRII